MLRTRVQCRAVLAITATATASTAAAVARVLDIAPDGIIRDDSVRANLRLSVTHTNGGAQLSHASYAYLLQHDDWHAVLMPTVHVLSCRAALAPWNTEGMPGGTRLASLCGDLAPCTFGASWQHQA